MKRLLDVGGGNQPKIMEDFETIAMDRHDFSADYVGKDNLYFVKANMTNTFPFEDNTFDLVWSNHALEHLPHQLADGRDALVFVINEMGRVVKPGGEVHICVPWVEHTNAYRHPGHYRFFNYDIFNWFDDRNPTPDHEAYGYTNKLRLVVNEIRDNCHVYATFKKL